MDDQTKNKLINRVHRIEGQARGIENMIRENRDYREIIIQLRALSSASKQIVSELTKQLLNKKDLTQSEKDYILRLIKEN